MAELFNLRQFRKKQKRKKEAKIAQENRINFGRTKIEKQFDQRLNLETKNFLIDNQLSEKKTD